MRPQWERSEVMAGSDLSDHLLTLKPPSELCNLLHWGALFTTSMALLATTFSLFCLKPEGGSSARPDVCCHPVLCPVEMVTTRERHPSPLQEH